MTIKETRVLKKEIEVPEHVWAAKFITYNEETHMFIAWDETSSIILDSFDTWEKAKICCFNYAETLNPTTAWNHIATAPLATFILIKGSSGMMLEKEYVIKAKYSTEYKRWLTVQNDAVSDEFTSPPTHWMEIPE